MHAFLGRDFADRVNFASEPRVVLHVVDGGYSDARQAAAAYAAEKGIHAEGGFFNYARREGIKTAYLEAFDSIPEQVDVVFQAISSGMGLLAAYKGSQEYLRLGRLSRLPRFVGVQEATCAPMGSWRRIRCSMHGSCCCALPAQCSLITQVMPNQVRTTQLVRLRLRWRHPEACGRAWA